MNEVERGSDGMAMDQHEDEARAIGPWGTATRLAVGMLLISWVVIVQAPGGFDPAPWLLGLLGFPAALLAWQLVRARRTAQTLHATGTVGHVVCFAIGGALAFTPDYLPALSVTKPAIAVFYGASLLLAVIRGYAGCEVLAVSNWLLRRDDQVGCVFFTPIDEREHHASSRP
jgi:hypothetical protein